MASFIGTTCSIIQGTPTPMVERSTTWSVPGINGTGIHYHGTEGVNVNLNLVFYGTTSAADSWYSTIAAKVESIGSVVIGSTTYANQRCVKVGNLQKRGAVNGTTQTVRYSCTAVVQSVG